MRPSRPWTQQPCVPHTCSSIHSLLLSLGRRCEICDDGFFGDPLGLSGDPQPCQRCQCSGNVDPNAVGNCDPLSGHCLHCLYNTTGAHCDHCQEGFYGNALAPWPSDKCVREYPLPGPTGWVRRALSPPDPAAALRGCATSGRFLTFSVSCPENVSVYSSPRLLQPWDLISFDPVIVFFPATII